MEAELFVHETMEAKSFIHGNKLSIFVFLGNTYLMYLKGKKLYS
jgi:hypothetical protein